ncbi:MAG: ATP-binding protein [Candidatus Marsarchaeota archaeon]|nr:ATP-binding protein [Candidatus Marsarchaeota archaeon]
MVQDIVISKLLSDIIPMAVSSTSESEISTRFAKIVSDIFGIEKVEINAVKNMDSAALMGFVANTKKSFVDNQLSEYSSFPELIAYMNQGFKSYAAIPLIGDGKVVSVLGMASKVENKFSSDLVAGISIGASYMSYVLMYKSELGRSIRLATYFDAAFNNVVPQLIIGDDGSVIKFNKSAIKALSLSVPEMRKIDAILGTGFKELLDLSNGTKMKIAHGLNGNENLYAITSSKINDKLLHITANEITEAFRYEMIDDAITKAGGAYMIFTDANLKILSIVAKSDSLGYSNSVLESGNLVELASKVEREKFQKEITNPEGSTGRVTMEIGSRLKHMRYISKKTIDGYLFIFVDADAEFEAAKATSDFEDFLSATSDLVFRIDSFGIIRDSNMPVEAILGYSKDEVQGKDVKLLYLEQDILDRDINYVRNGGKVDNSFINLFSKQGGQVPATHSIRAISGDKSKGEFIILIKELATKRRLGDTESRMRKTESEIKGLKSEGDLKSQFIYNISHELKTPLTSIKGYSRLLYDGEFGPLNDEQKGYLQTTLQEAERLMLIIQQVLDAAKLDAAQRDATKVKLDYKEVDLKNMANNPSIKALEESAKNKGLEFKWQIGYDVSPINADLNRLIQVFVNLIGNSIKFTEKGGITVKIEKRTRSTIRCSIEDTGIGISEDDKKRLFRKRFYEATKKGLVQQPGAGTGLGLSICRDIIKLHGGKISVESQGPGKGSTFWFELPITRKTKRKNDQKEKQESA